MEERCRGEEKLFAWRHIERKANSSGEIERKTFSPGEVKIVDETLGIVEHIVAVMGNLDMGGDIIHNGAFAKTITERMGKIRVVDAHNYQSVLSVIGKPLALWEVGKEMLPAEMQLEHPDATGALIARTQFLMDTPEGSGAFQRIQTGAVDEYSIGYDALDVEFEKVDGQEWPVRHLRSIKLYEYGPVVFGMNPATTTLSAKDAEAGEEGTDSDNEPDLSLDADTAEAEKEADAISLLSRELEKTDDSINDEDKAGRVLSGRNATAVVNAVVALASVLEDAGIDVPGFSASEAEEETEAAADDTPLKMQNDGSITASANLVLVESDIVGDELHWADLAEGVLTPDEVDFVKELYQIASDAPDAVDGRAAIEQEVSDESPTDNGAGPDANGEPPTSIREAWQTQVDIGISMLDLMEVEV